MLIKTNLSNDVVAVAMSGGVDSTIAAALMQKEGYETIGLTMRLFADSNLEKAKYSAKQLGISHHIIDFEEIFREKIIQNFINEYLMGHTPNPCVLCNKFIKFGALLDYAHSLGAKFLITGHYAQIIYNKERYCLAKGLDKTKEQSYFLWSLRQEQLANIKFPLGKYHKSEIKQLAKELKLTSAEAKESQEICFIPDDDYKKFLLKYFSDFSDFSSSSSSLETIRSGLIMNSNGEILGEHKGIPFYTIGQRRGLGISYSKPLYVYKMDVENNIIYVGTGEELYSTNMIIKDINWVSWDKPHFQERILAKIRYRHIGAYGFMKSYDDDNGNGKRLHFVFETPQRAITSGQSAVFYKDDKLLAGGIINVN